MFHQPPSGYADFKKEMWDNLSSKVWSTFVTDDLWVISSSALYLAVVDLTG
jgi:hypothetical protein